jgi:hypothetical protein
MKSVDKVPERIKDMTNNMHEIPKTGTLVERQDFDTPIQVKCSECGEILLIAKFGNNAFLDRLVITCQVCLRNGKHIQAIGGSIPEDTEL